jgi:hypothetical protein
MRGFSNPSPDGPIGVTPDRLADAIAVLERAGDQCAVSLFRAVRDRRIALGFVPRGVRGGGIRSIKRARLPAVVLLPDDDGLSTGPAGFPAARSVLRWCRGLLLHAAGGEPVHYEMAVEMAEAEGSCALIETGTEHAEAWLEAARRAAAPRRHRTLAIWPRNGLHPIPMPREAVQ